MKTGKQTPRLSEKLAEDMENLRSENAALMDTQLKSFRTDLKAIADDALLTIQSDMDAQLLKLRQKWVTENRKHSGYRTWSEKWLILAMVTLTLVTTLGFAQMILTYRTSWQALGIERIEQGSYTFLILESETTTLRRCMWAGEERDCIRIEE